MIRPRRTCRNWPPPDSLDWEDRNLFSAAGIIVGGIAAALAVGLQLLIEWSCR